MNDLISRQVAIEAIKDHINFVTTDTEGYNLARRHMMELIAVLPSASAKCIANITVQYPEVLCVSCKHCEQRNNDEPYCHHHAMVVTPDYFCADGEEGEWVP